jgi:hypothetical protein
MKNKFRTFVRIITLLLFGAIGYQGYKIAAQYIYENAVLKQIISRLEADSRVAEVLVTGVNYNEVDQKTYTTIKFLEYDSSGRPLSPKYFTFSGNIIQFQSLVVRFEDMYIRQADRLKGKSAYLFWKVFMLDGKETQEYEITKIDQIPEGYRLSREENPVEAAFWKHFWEYALNPQRAGAKGIKNAQIEAPGTMFVPGNLYTIKIEHDGGLRIDAAPLSKILLGEQIPL